MDCSGLRQLQWHLYQRMVRSVLFRMSLLGTGGGTRRFALRIQRLRSWRAAVSQRFLFWD